ncbi:uncharacterized protein LOC132706102 isoform X3 [Cylas formicarius]|uniref:uncharacterized protein LOC132706102 isoform X3 n=1 Tax=Cylas formicarius TaxID=197179 RepID=UPI002958CEC8|nr:uncharacterized protein LOC132706102 isoform X3 [Cylas formicarius]
MHRDSYSEYRKAAQENLLDINNNLSAMLRESFAGIDAICQKVRMCFLESKLSCDTSGTKDERQNLIAEQHSILDISTIEEDSNEDKDDNKIEMETDYKRVPKENKVEAKVIRQRPKKIKPFFTILNSKETAERTGGTPASQTPTMRQPQPTTKLKGLSDDYKRRSTTSTVRGKSIRRIEETKCCAVRITTREADRSSESDPSSVDQYIGRNEFLFDRLSTSPAVDVYRKKAATNLHGKLIAQVEASDSLAFFQKVMTRNKSRMSSRSRPATVAEMGRRTGVGSTAESNTIRSAINLPRKYDNSLWFNRKNLAKTRKKTEGNVSNRIEPCFPKTYSANPCRMLQDRRRPATADTVRIRQLDHFDILDDITANDLVPFEAEYPRKDAGKIQEIEKSPAYGKVKDSFLYDLVYGEEKENVWSYLFGPSIKCSAENCRICEKSPANGRGDDIGKLHKYIFPNQDVKEEGVTKVYTVMPVHVIYNKARLNAATADGAQKLPLAPMKECKETQKRAEWFETGKKNKPMKVVYDPALRRIDKEIKLVSATQEKNPRHLKHTRTKSWSPKNFDEYCRTVAGPATMQKPKNIYQSDCIDIFRRSPKGQSPKLPMSERFTERSNIKPNYTSPSPSDYLNLDTRVWTQDNTKPMPRKAVNAQTSDKLEAMLKKNGKSEREKKLWENKYGKTPAQKLTKFIENQPVHYQLSPPKHAMPNEKKVSKNRFLSRLSADQPSVRQNAVLEQLKTLKQKNDHVSSNIQKAIEVIENKMVDILSKPKATDSVEAFDEMEQEITNVLTLMKAPSVRIANTTAIVEEDEDAKLENEVDVSDQLIKKLESILSSAVDTSSAASLANDLPNETLKGKQPSTTSTSTEETYTVKQRYRKQTPKSKTPSANKNLPTTNNSRSKEIGDRSKSADISRANLTSAGDQAKTFDTENKSQSIATILNRGDCEWTVTSDKTKIVGNDANERIQQETKEDIAAENRTVSSETEANVSSKSSTTMTISKAEKISNASSNEQSLEGLECSLEERTEQSARQAEKPRLYDEVNKIISRVENVYSQLEEFEEEVKHEELPKVSTFKDEPCEMDVKSDMFLTPFMHALKDLGKRKENNESTDRSPSYYNIIRFLDTLSDLREDQPLEVYTARHYQFPRQVHIPNTFHILDIQHSSHYIPTPTLSQIPRPSESLPIINAATNKHQPPAQRMVQRKPSGSGRPANAVKFKKSNQHFAVKASKQEKATQATPCPLHNTRLVTGLIDSTKRKLSEEICSSEADDTSILIDQINQLREIEKTIGPFHMSTDLQKAECQFSECCKEEEKSDTNSNASKEIIKIEDKNLVEISHPTIIEGNYGKRAMQEVKRTLSQDDASKKRNSLERLKQKEETFLKETVLQRPIRHLNDFIDPELLKRAVQERQQIRMSRRKSMTDIVQTKKTILKSDGEKHKGQKETLLKGVYAFVYLLMFTALNLEYKCVY